MKDEYPEIQIVPPTNKLVSTSAIRWFLAGIPAEVKKLVSQLQYYQIVALRLLRMSKEAVDLFIDVPVLFFALCHQIWFEDMPYGEARRLCCGKRKNIIQKLFGETCYSPSFFRKLHPNKYDSSRAESLLAFLASEKNNKAVLHWENISFHAAYGYHCDERILSSRFIQKYARFETACVLEGAYQLAVEIDSIGETRIPPVNKKELLKCRNYGELKKLHEEMLSRPTAEDCEGLVAHYGKEFPAHLIQGTENIVPLQTVYDLKEEGEVMQHCVFSLAQSAYEGKSSFYQVLTPERATLEVYATSDGSYGYECNLANNRRPSGKTRKMIEQWLSSQDKV